MKNIAFENNYFRVEHVTDCQIAGYCILFPKQDVLSIADLSLAAQQSFGETLAFIQQALKQTINPERIYTLAFSEVLPTLHIHIFPRTNELAQKYKTAFPDRGNSISGAFLFEWAREFYQKQATDNYQQSMQKFNDALVC